MLDVDKVVYINLEHRKDRKEHIERELSKVFPPEKILRFEAIKDSHGGIGCTKSHIAVLNMAIENKWKNYLVVEDDMTWNNLSGISTLEKYLSVDHDVIVLGGSFVTLKQDGKLLSCQTTTAYIVSNIYYNKLLSNFQEGLDLFVKTNNYNAYAIDQYWKKLQASDNWYIIRPCLSIQLPGYSDIENKNVNYIHFFS